MKTIYYTASSLDGFIATPEHSLDWLLQFGAPPEESYEALMRGIGAIAMGSSTYEWMLRHDVFADPEQPKPWSYAQPTWVFSTRTLRTVPGADIRFVSGDVRRVHAEIREAIGERDLWLVGGGDLAGQFHDHGLLDELIVTYVPVTLGGGAPLLPRRIAHPPMQLVSVRQLGPAFAELHYRVR